MKSATRHPRTLTRSSPGCRSRRDAFALERTRFAETTAAMASDDGYRGGDARTSIVARFEPSPITSASPLSARVTTSVIIASASSRAGDSYGSTSDDALAVAADRVGKRFFFARRAGGRGAAAASTPLAGVTLAESVIFAPRGGVAAPSTLVASEQLDLAYALGAAGMGIHPHSEDMLAINGLLALMQQDWPQAVDYLQELMDIQSANTQAFTYVMMVRALRCNLDPARALQVARQGLQAFPEQLELVAESLALEDYADLVGVSAQIQ